MEDQPTPEQDVTQEIKPWHFGLTDKQRRFVEEYCIDFNGARAARAAGYDEASAKQQAHENLTKPYLRAAIDAYLDTLSMTSGEGLLRLTRWGRGDLSPFLQDDGTLSLSSPSALANIHLVKKAKITTRTERAPQGSTQPDADITSVEIELHDAKDAVKTILQVRGRLVEKHEHSGKDGAPIQHNMGQLITPEDVEAFAAHFATKYQ